MFIKSDTHIKSFYPNKQPTHTGEISWGGLASTLFWIDPKEKVYVILLTQLVPAATYNFRRDLRVLVNQALL
jgi:CubicO group peptidase (beta-lactamase class C family)